MEKCCIFISKFPYTVLQFKEMFLEKATSTKKMYDAFWISGSFDGCLCVSSGQECGSLCHC